MPDWAATFGEIHDARVARAITFRRAATHDGSGGAVYAADRTLTCGVEYKERGFDPERGVTYPFDNVQVQIWLRDYFSRSTDGATTVELTQFVSDIQGQVAAGDAEKYTRFIVDGASLKYENHAFEHRPDGVVYAAVLRLVAA